jgi:hypothetical protein
VLGVRCWPRDREEGSGGRAEAVCGLVMTRLRVECYDWKTRRWLVVGVISTPHAVRPYVAGGLGAAVFRVVPRARPPPGGITADESTARPRRRA